MKTRRRRKTEAYNPAIFDRSLRAAARIILETPDKYGGPDSLMVQVSRAELTRGLKPKKIHLREIVTQSKLDLR